MGESESNGGAAPDAKNVMNTFMISEDDMKDRALEMRGFIDETRYVVYTSKRLNQMAVKWRDWEKRAFRSQQHEAVGKLKEIPGSKALHASRTSNVAKHSLPQCMKRAQNGRTGAVPGFMPGRTPILL